MAPPGVVTEPVGVIAEGSAVGAPVPVHPGPRRPGEPIWESYAPEEPAEPAGPAVADDAAPTTVLEGDGAATERIEKPTGIPDGETERLVRM